MIKIVTETAVQAYLRTAITLIPSAQIYRDSEQTDTQDTEAEDQTVILPAIIISVESAQQANPMIGVYSARVRVRVKTNQDDTISTDFLSYLKDVRAALNVQDLPSQLNTLANNSAQDFHCFGFSDSCSDDEEVTGRSRDDYIDVNLAVSPYPVG